MSAVRFFMQSGEIASSTSAKTILQLIAASNHRVKVTEVAIAFKGTNNTAAPILVELVRQSDAGSGSSSATVTKEDESADETLQTSGIKGCTSEPTGSTVVMAFEVHPQAGMVWQAPFGGELLVKGGTRLGLRVTAGADVNCVASFRGDE